MPDRKHCRLGILAQQMFCIGTNAVPNPAIIIHFSHAELVSANFCTAFMPDSENIEPIGR